MVASACHFHTLDLWGSLIRIGASDCACEQQQRFPSSFLPSFSSPLLLHMHTALQWISDWNSAKVCLGKMGGRSTLAAIGDTFFFSAFSLRCYLWHCPVLAAIKGVFSKARVKHRTLGISDQLGGNMPSYKSAYHTLLWYPTTHVRGLENRENK